jgi:hypothetical protein
VNPPNPAVTNSGLQSSIFVVLIFISDDVSETGLPPSSGRNLLCFAQSLELDREMGSSGATEGRVTPTKIPPMTSLSVHHRLSRPELLAAESHCQHPSATPTLAMEPLPLLTCLLPTLTSHSTEGTHDPRGSITLPQPPLGMIFTPLLAVTIL